MAAATKGMAAQQAAQRQPQALCRAMGVYCFLCVMRTGRGEPAGCAQ